MKIGFWMAIGLASGVASSIQAQTVNEQAWFEYMLEYPFANAYNFENALTYSTVAGQPKWRAFDYSGSWEWSVSPYVELIAQGVFSYTNQAADYNTFEIRPVIGSKIYLTPNKRVQTKLLLRLEQRNFKNLETKSWERATRPRVRAELAIPINKKSYFVDDLWYALIDAELLFADKDVEERFANRYRVRTGIGYRLSYTWRFELMYMNQKSKDAINDIFTSNDNVFRFRVKHYLRKTNPATPMGVGN